MLPKTLNGIITTKLKDQQAAKKKMLILGQTEVSNRLSSVKEVVRLSGGAKKHWALLN